MVDLRRYTLELHPTKDEPRNALTCVGSCMSIPAGLQGLLNVGSLECTCMPAEKGYYANDPRKTRRGNSAIRRSRVEHERGKEIAGRRL